MMSIRRNNNEEVSSSVFFFYHQGRRQQIWMKLMFGTGLIVFFSSLYMSGYLETDVIMESALSKKKQSSSTTIVSVKNDNNDVTYETTSMFPMTNYSIRYTSKDQLLLTEECKASLKKDNTLWSNRPHKPSRINSLFNCDLSDAKCKYYYPANFLNNECGLGKEFAYYINFAKSKQAHGVLWNSQPSIGFPILTLNEMCILDNDTRDYKRNKVIRNIIESKTSKSKMKSEMVLKNIGEQHVNITVGDSEDDAILHCLTERLSFIHTHKCGGSSLHGAFHGLARTINRYHAKIVDHKFFTPNFSPGNNDDHNKVDKKKLDSAMERKKWLALRALKEATRYPSEDQFNHHQHVMFAVVRDPTERFISSIGQALAGIGSVGNKIGYKLKKQCLKSTSRETLNCLAKYVRDHGFWFELHFLPQVLDIGFTTMWQDVPIAVFAMKPYLKTILTYLGSADAKFRDGSIQNYRSDPILTNMTVADYDDETLEIVCQIYEMDVRMQRSLGIEVPSCDPYIPKNYDFS